MPDGATGVVLNVTVGEPDGRRVRVDPPGRRSGLPTTSSLNFSAGDIIPNSVTVQVPTSGADVGKIEITYDAFGNAGPTTEILIDLVGYTKNAGLASLQAQVNALQAFVNAARPERGRHRTVRARRRHDKDRARAGKIATSRNDRDRANAINNTHIVNNSLTIDNLGPNSVGRRSSSRHRRPGGDEHGHQRGNR